jgi:two-component system OmpR family sensor kinase
MRHPANPLARTSLRVRLTALTVLLVAVGLVAAGVATHQALQGFLIDRVDQEFTNQVGRGRPGENTLPPGSYSVFYTEAGQQLFPTYFTPPGTVPPQDLLQAVASAPEGTTTRGDYRVRVVEGRLLDGTPGRLVTAIPLDDVRSTLARLALLELLIGVVVLVIVGGVAYVAVRREFRPLLRIEDTASAIAAGDLSRRVEDADPVTEVGRLGASLNAMLSQIEIAFKERQASENRLRRFVADASHELRTPLTSVRGYAELFRRGASDNPDDLAVVMGRIEAEAERMGILVEDLLLLAKLDQGPPLGQESIDLSALVREMVNDHRMLHQEWPIDEETAPGLTVYGDELRIRQAIVNLLSNARSHTPPGTQITVTTASADDMARIEVADEGPGVPAEIGDRVFEGFFRADESRTRSSGGAGLGLAIVAAIASAHGGRPEVESRPGEGATFRILLPLATTAADVQAVPSEGGDATPID